MMMMLRCIVGSSSPHIGSTVDCNRMSMRLRRGGEKASGWYWIYFLCHFMDMNKI